MLSDLPANLSRRSPGGDAGQKGGFAGCGGTKGNGHRRGAHL